jgi:hypothetical protein
MGGKGRVIERSIVRVDLYIVGSDSGDISIKQAGSDEKYSIIPTWTTNTASWSHDIIGSSSRRC